jgi:SOS-response transcriptional repressor LexA
MTKDKQRDPDDLKLSDKLIKNITYLVNKSRLSQLEIAALAKIPSTTLNGIIIGTSINPKLHTLAAIARVFDIHVAQLIGEVPLNFSEITIPILNWPDLDVQKKVINHKVDENTNFISSGLITKNLVFALKVNSKISDIYRENSTIILEETDQYINNDLVILSINNSEPSIKKIIKEGAEVFLESVTSKLPIQQYDHQNTHIFGIIRETRF